MTAEQEVRVQKSGTRDSVQTHFNASAAGYDTFRRFLIPNFDEFYSFGIDVLSCPKNDPSVLDLGGGTGLSTYYLLRRYPAAQVTLVDFSEEMLRIAKERFKNNEKVHFKQADYRSVDLDANFDIVISGLSLHHLTHKEKQALTKRVYASLAPSGEFMNADIIKGENEEIDRTALRRLEAFLREGLFEDKVHRFFASMEHDIPATMSENLGFMEKAGFSTIDCVYRYWNYGVFYGKK